MVRDMPLADSLQRAVQLVVEFMRSDSCLLYLIDEKQLVLTASNAPKPNSIGKVHLKLTEGLTGWVARERRLLTISREAYRDPRLAPSMPKAELEAFLSDPAAMATMLIFGMAAAFAMYTIAASIGGALGAKMLDKDSTA